MTDLPLDLPRAELLAWLDGLATKERREVAAVAAGLPLRRHDPREPHRLLVLAATATSARRLAEVFLYDRVAPEDLDDAVALLARRPPAFVERLTAACLEDAWVGCWPLVRALVRAGVVKRPTAASYATGLPWGLTRGEEPVLAALERDPGLLDDEVSLLFAEQGCGALLQSADKSVETGFAWSEAPPLGPQATWRHALAALAADGRLDRDRLLDAALGAFLRDWPSTGLGWYLGLLDALAPTPQEVAARQALLLRLLVVAPGQAAAWTQKRLKGLPGLDVPALLAVTPAVLTRPDKTVPLGQLRLVARLDGDVAPAVLPGLGHPALEVQRAVLDLIEARVSEEERSALLVPYAGSVSPLLRDRLPAPVPEDVDVAAVVAAALPGRVQPVRDPDELLGLLTRLVEEADDPVDVERALEGAARLARQRPADGHVLDRRAQELLEELFAFGGEDVRADLCVLALVWLHGVDPGEGYPGQLVERVYEQWTVREVRDEGWHLPALLARRTHEVARLVAAGGGQLLALPSTADGAIDPADLRDRLSRVPRTGAPHPLDLTTAALRLPLGVEVPGGLHRTARALATAVASLAALEPRYERVVGRAPAEFGEPRERVVAWRITGSSRSATDAVAALYDVPDPLVAAGQSWDHGEFTSRFDQVVALWPLVLPGRPELLAAHSHGRLCRALSKNRSGTGPLLRALGASAVPNGPVGSSAFALGLAARNGDERVATVDALLDLAERDRLDGAELGRQLRAHLADDVVVGSRVVASLQEVARAHPRGYREVLTTVEQVLELAAGRKDAGAWLGLAAELAAA